MERDLKNHAHDSIGCCCSDKVHQEIVSRFLLAEDMADNLIRFYLRKKVPYTSEVKKQAVLTYSWPREEVLSTTIRLRASQFRLVDSKGHEIPYFIRQAREIDPGLYLEADKLCIMATTSRSWSSISN